MRSTGVIQGLIGRQRSLRWWLPLLLCALLSSQVAAQTHVHLDITTGDCQLCLQGADQLPAVNTATPSAPVELAPAEWVPTSVVLPRCTVATFIRGPPNTF